MPQASVKLSGWKAGAIILAVVALAWFRAAQQARSLDSQAREVLAAWVASDYLRAAIAATTEPLDSATAQRILRDQRVAFSSLAARGHGDDIVVRAEITVEGHRPPDGRSTRYFRMGYSLGSGWRLRGETAAIAYYLHLW